MARSSASASTGSVEVIHSFKREARRRTSAGDARAGDRRKAVRDHQPGQHAGDDDAWRCELVSNRSRTARLATSRRATGSCRPGFLSARHGHRRQTARSTCRFRGRISAAASSDSIPSNFGDLLTEPVAGQRTRRHRPALSRLGPLLVRHDVGGRRVRLGHGLQDGAGRHVHNPPRLHRRTRAEPDLDRSWKALTDLFYGVTQFGGAFDRGTIFRMTPEGDVTVLYHFTGGTDGGSPISGLTLATMAHSSARHPLGAATTSASSSG